MDDESKYKVAHSYSDVFLSWEDAVLFIEGHIRDNEKGDIKIVQQSVYRGYQGTFRAEVTFSNRQ